MIEQAAAVCAGHSGHPGLRWIEDLHLISSAGIWDHRFGAFLYSNACVVAGLRAAARLAAAARPERAGRALGGAGRPDLGGGHPRRVRRRPSEPGLIDPEHGRFLDARRLSTLRGLWTDRPELLIDRSTALDISMLGPVVPFGLLPASDPPDGPHRRGDPPEQRDPGEPEPPDPLVAGPGPAGAQLRAGRVARPGRLAAWPRSGWPAT